MESDQEDIGLPPEAPVEEAEPEAVDALEPICLSAEDIFGADDHETQWVACPEWAPPGTAEVTKGRYGVRVHQLNGTERDAYEAAMIKGKGKKTRATYDNVRAKLVARSCRDDDGKRIFSDRQAAELGLKSSKVLDRIFDACQELNGMTEADIDELEGN